MHVQAALFAERAARAGYDGHGLRGVTLTQALPRMKRSVSETTVSGSFSTLASMY